MNKGTWLIVALAILVLSLTVGAVSAAPLNGQCGGPGQPACPIAPQANNPAQPVVTTPPLANPQGGQPNQPTGQNPQPNRQPNVPLVDGGNCAGLVPTSPLDGLAHGSNIFYWNGITGVTSYRVNVYGMDVNAGTLYASFSTSGIETHVNGDLSGYAGYKMAWNVEALVNGAVVCTSQTYTMGHAAS